MIGECLCVWLWTSVWDRFGQPTNSRSIYVHKTTTTTTTTTKTEKSSTFRPIIHWWRIYFIIHISLNHYGHIWMISLAYLTCWSRSHRSHLYIWWYADTGTDTFTSATIKVPFTHTHTNAYLFVHLVAKLVPFHTHLLHCCLFSSSHFLKCFRSMHLAFYLTGERLGV